MSNKQHQSPLRLALLTTLLLLALGGCNKSEDAATLMAQGQKYQQAGNNVAALIQFKNAVAKDPKNAEARFALGSAYNRIGDPLSAEKEVRKAMEMGVPVERTLPELLAAQLFQNQFQKVIDATEQAAYTSTPRVTSQRAVALYQLGKKAEAAEAFERALKADPAYPVALMGLAKIALEKQDKDTAAKYVEENVRRNPKDVDTWLFKGDFERTVGNAAGALAAYDQVLVLDPGSSSAHLQKSFVYMREKKFPEALVALDAAKRISPKNINVTYLRGMLDFTEGKYPLALESLQQVLKVAPEHLPSILLTGAVQYQLKSYPQAEKNLKKYVESDPDSDYARKLLASTRVAMGDPKGAIAVLEPLIEKSEDPQLLGIAGNAYMANRQYAKATATFERASVLDPKKAPIRTALGLATLEEGNQARAMTEMELATTLDLNSSEAGMTLAVTALRLQQYDKALVASAELVKRLPTDPMARNLAGLAHLGKQNRVAARASFEDALKVQPDYFPALDNLARMDLQEKKPELTRQRYQDFLEKNPKSVEVMTALGAFAVAQGRPAEATPMLERAHNLDPAAVGPAIFLASHYAATGGKAKALTMVRKLQVANPDNPKVLDQLARLQFSNGDNGAAMETFTKLTVVAPRSAEAHFLLGSAHLAMNNLPSATASLKRALTLQPDYLDAQLVLAGAHLRQRQFDDAIGVARSVQKQRPGLAVGYVSEADVHMVTGKAAVAVPLYEKAFGIGKNAELLVKYTAALAANGRPADAEERIARWRREQPADLKVPAFVAERHLYNRNYQLAASEIEAILKKRPADPALLNNLAFAYDKLKDPRAIPTAEQALKLAPDNPLVLDTLGWMHTERNNVTKGVAILQKASAAAPWNPEIRYHLIQAFVKSQDMPAASKEFDLLAARNRDFPQLEAARKLVKK